jgi:hypothetical protein
MVAVCGWSYIDIYLHAGIVLEVQIYFLINIALFN